MSARFQYKVPYTTVTRADGSVERHPASADCASGKFRMGANGTFGCQPVPKRRKVLAAPAAPPPALPPAPQPPPPFVDSVKPPFEAPPIDAAFHKPPSLFPTTSTAETKRKPAAPVDYWTPEDYAAAKIEQDRIAEREAKRQADEDAWRDAYEARLSGEPDEKYILDALEALPIPDAVAKAKIAAAAGDRDRDSKDEKDFKKPPPAKERKHSPVSVDDSGTVVLAPVNVAAKKKQPLALDLGLLDDEFEPAVQAVPAEATFADRLRAQRARRRAAADEIFEPVDIFAETAEEKRNRLFRERLQREAAERAAIKAAEDAEFERKLAQRRKLYLGAAEVHDLPPGMQEWLAARGLDHTKMQGQAWRNALDLFNQEKEQDMLDEIEAKARYSPAKAALEQALREVEEEYKSEVKQDPLDRAALEAQFAELPEDYEVDRAKATADEIKALHDKHKRDIDHAYNVIDKAAVATVAGLGAAGLSYMGPVAAWAAKNALPVVGIGLFAPGQQGVWGPAFQDAAQVARQGFRAGTRQLNRAIRSVFDEKKAVVPYRADVVRPSEVIEPEDVAEAEPDIAEPEAEPEAAPAPERRYPLRDRTKKASTIAGNNPLRGYGWDLPESNNVIFGTHN